mmetsp:Transcript_25379/g.67423  ORF Transcript_25379/g.67423 Transcript_25379/m.67423 type:complete len:450 (-) Transcript_25379:373-1722(-)
MAPQLAVQNTFLHLIDNEVEEEEDQPEMTRCATEPVSAAHSRKFSQSMSLASASTDADDIEEGPRLLRDTTFDAFEMPCALGDGDIPGDGAVDDAEDVQPGMTRSSTWDPFEADVQDSLEPSGVVLPSLLSAMLPSMCTKLGMSTPSASMRGAHLTSGSASQAESHAKPQDSVKLLPAAIAEAAETRAMSTTKASPQLAADISCTYLPNGVVRMQWAADSRRFAGRSATAVSPAFSADVPGIGTLTFKIIIHAAAMHKTKGSCNFQSSRGHSVIELKCESQLPSAAVCRADKSYRVHVNKVAGSRLGIDLESRSGEPWWIKTMSDGLISQWNCEHPEQKVNLGDSIVEVNGVSGDLAKVRDACTKCGPLSMVLQRDPEASPSFDVRFGIGGGSVPAQKMRGPVRHDFAAESCCGLRSGDQVWDLLSAVDKTARKVRVVCELARVSTRSP